MYEQQNRKKSIAESSNGFRHRKMQEKTDLKQPALWTITKHSCHQNPSKGERGGWRSVQINNDEIFSNLSKDL
jgi:hypothetical protein